MQDPQTNARPRESRLGTWLLFLAGLGLFVVGPTAYTLQMRLKNLATPWYMPILATVGVMLMIQSLRRRRGFVRAALLVPLALACGFEWFVVGIASRTPAYTGPALVGSHVPAFAARFADGTPFTEANLTQGKPSVFLFFRGRW